MLTIDQESRQRTNVPYDPDFMGDRYRTENGVYNFPAPFLWTIEKNLFYLLKNSTESPLLRMYHYRPDYLSFDTYNTVCLWNLILYVNQVACLEDFTIDTVVLPTMSSIIDICQDKFPAKDRTNLQKIKW